jgi:hypothetical protein
MVVLNPSGSEAAEFKPRPEKRGNLFLLLEQDIILASGCQQIICTRLFPPERGH